MTSAFLRLHGRLAVALSALFFLEASAQAADDARKCYLEKFIKHIGYQDVLSADANLASLDASLGSEARCRYRVQFSPCIGTAIERLNAAAMLGKTSPRTQKAVLKVDVVRRVAEHGVEIVYNVEKTGFFSSPKFSSIRLSERFFGLPIRTHGKIAGADVKVWRDLCELGQISEAKFMKRIGAAEEAGTKR
jgi:hypothetical protein